MGYVKMSSENESPQETARILFVDDEENILRALKRLFMDEDCEVFTASSGADALKILEESEEICVIVSDQRMPEMTGVDFLEKSRKISPQSIRILLTGYADINAAVDAINRGGTFRYITKPWKDDELLQVIKSAQQQYFLIKENKRLNAIVKKQNAELKKWSEELEGIVQEQTMELQKSYDDLRLFNAHLRTNFKSTIIAFSGLLELRDKRMRNHSKNVAEIAGNVARKLGMPSGEREVLVVASLLHDIGKIGISDVMLQVDEEDMHPDEKSEYMKHPVRGQAVVDIIDDLREAGNIIRHHHESYDGTGFPDNLKKKDIPLASRIIAIIDFVDKQVRKFKAVSSLDTIFEMVTEDEGKRFDPKLVPLVEEQARKFYKKQLPKTGSVEMEFHPRELKSGMIASRDVYSGTGILLLSKGSVLEKTSINLLKRYYELDPSRHGVFVTFEE